MFPRKLTVRSHNTYNSSSIHESYAAWIGHDFPEKLPLPNELTSVHLTVENTEHYPLGDGGARAWHSTDTRSRGYARLGPRARLFAVAMFHELHCLRIFNAAFGTTGDIKHVAHCLSYLRHGALCAADLTLERGDWTAANASSAGATHVCRDWSAVYDAMEDNWDRWTAVRGVGS
ncbi:hypothetical protein AURDEDRAFT_63203 [Auricularia subglabra TFB-10046 SS5]|nr:hypothetical protein AURDEDRAFT_63203 [Auricularia subglabra TFB-10046 SS5]